MELLPRHTERSDDEDVVAAARRSARVSTYLSVASLFISSGALVGALLLARSSSGGPALSLVRENSPLKRLSSGTNYVALQELAIYQVSLHTRFFRAHATLCHTTL